MGLKCRPPPPCRAGHGVSLIIITYRKIFKLYTAVLLLGAAVYSPQGSVVPRGELNFTSFHLFHLPIYNCVFCPLWRLMKFITFFTFSSYFSSAFNRKLQTDTKDNILSLMNQTHTATLMSDRNDRSMLANQQMLTLVSPLTPFYHFLHLINMVLAKVASIPHLVWDRSQCTTAHCSVGTHCTN